VTYCDTFVKIYTWSGSYLKLHTLQICSFCCNVSAGLLYNFHLPSFLEPNLAKKQGAFSFLICLMVCYFDVYISLFFDLFNNICFLVDFGIKRTRIWWVRIYVCVDL